MVITIEYIKYIWLYPYLIPPHLSQRTAVIRIVDRSVRLRIAAALGVRSDQQLTQAFEGLTALDTALKYACGGAGIPAAVSGTRREHKNPNTKWEMTMKTLSIGLIAAALMAGCVSSGTKVTHDQIAAFEVGKTTEAQVIAAFGTPTSVSFLQDGTKSDVYLHTAAHATAATYVPVVGLFAGGAKGTTDTAVFNFDQNGVLKSTSSSTAQSDVRTGLANQK
jgi:hypothetical protein